MKEIKLFTFKAKGICRELITDCGISIPNGSEQSDVTEYKALWDTGASGSVISTRLAEQLGLEPISMRRVFHAGGQSMRNVYTVNLHLPGSVDVTMVEVTDGMLPHFDILIGMDIITRGDFAITNVGGKTTFTFRCPSYREVDFHAEYLSEVNGKGKSVLKTAPPSRNGQCPCGSGKKYKACCGK